MLWPTYTSILISLISSSSFIQSACFIILSFTFRFLTLSILPPQGLCIFYSLCLEHSCSLCDLDYIWNKYKSFYGSPQNTRSEKAVFKLNSWYLSLYPANDFSGLNSHFSCKLFKEALYDNQALHPKPCLKPEVLLYCSPFQTSW